MKNRNGKHKVGKVRIGVYVEPFRKAVALYLAEVYNKSMTDIVWEGIETVAKARGVILPNGEVSPEHIDALNISLETVKQSEVKG